MNALQPVPYAVGGLLLSILVVLGTAAAAAQGGPETAGYHLVRPGEDLDSVAQRYGHDSRPGRRQLRQDNPQARDPQPGDRVQVRLSGVGLPADSALVRRKAGRVDTQPTPVPWLKGRLFDLLATGDGLRTFPTASVELHFPDTSRLLLTEESLVFLRPSAVVEEETFQGDVEILEGQADLKNGSRREPGEETVEIVLGEARLQTRSNHAGEVAARARHHRGGAGQVMIFRGAGEIAAAGRRVTVSEGQGSVIPPGRPPAPPEPLLAAPYLISPVAGASAMTAPPFEWQEVEGAAAYTFELCLDVDCGELVQRAIGLSAVPHAVGTLSPGRYYWRVTAVASSGLDGFPSTPAVLGILAPPERSAQTAEDRPTALTEPPTTAPPPPSPIDLVARDEIVVRPSRISLLNRSVDAPLALSKDDILALPHLGGDLFRALPVLPGTSANDVSAEFHIRGGRRDEVKILLDGQELYDAYHLKDYDNALSIVAPDTLGGVELTTGGFSVEYGDRMGGVLDMTTASLQARPPGRRRWLGVSLLTSQVGGSGGFGDGKGEWLATARRGSIDLAGKFLDNEDPRFWDAFAKLTLRPSTSHTFTARLLRSDDDLAVAEVDGDEFKNRTTEHESTYLWATHQVLLNSQLFFQTQASWSEAGSRRQAVEVEDEAQFAILDERDFDVLEGRQDWGYQPNPRHTLSWGVGWRRFDAPYHYFSDRNFETPLAEIRIEPKEGIFAFQGRFKGDDWSAYLSDRIRLGERVTLEVGARHDRHSLLDESRTSPRLNLAWSASESTVVRAAWGEFTQSQRPHELQVEDGRLTFAELERADHALLGVEHLFQRGWAQGMALRVEAYRRLVDNPRVRFENLYEPFNVFPELEPERVRVTPFESRSRGIEIFLRSSPERRVRWWVNYAYARTEDRLRREEAGDDRTWVPRAIDQPHTLNVNVDLTLGRRWHLNAAWRLHTGWPTTPLSVVEVAIEADGEEGEFAFVVSDQTEFLPVLGPRNSERLPVYHRLDLRLSREFSVRRGKLTFFVDIQNVYDRRNQSGIDFEIDDEVGLVPTLEEWPGIFPSVGVRWEF